MPSVKQKAAARRNVKKAAAAAKSKKSISHLSKKPEPRSLSRAQRSQRNIERRANTPVEALRARPLPNFDNEKSIDPVKEACYVRFCVRRFGR